ncbi:C40 family peptidase [Spongiactinospora sp. TRM90649]|uniref:C40 family peptidase n=1 Tax=Spongiactinospora sp. TRM90649 TaxID=3031114 RepID=UPI0023F71499|nr:C40 family peptidase [Spongiactinospora sp. TRM90649]MDF5758439.1 C40 family peptidase [Spongiactinospora sp. TRM90649]
MIDETGLTASLAVGACLAVGVALLAGMSSSAHYALTSADAICKKAAPVRPSPREIRPGLPSSDVCAQLPDVATALLAGAELGVLAVQAALRMRGMPYSWGGGGPGGPSLGIAHGAHTRGFDCSGLTEYAWSQAGARIGGDTSAQWKAGSRVPRSQIAPGDLIFFATDPASPATIHHVGLAIDATRMVHAPSTGSTVRIDSWAGVPDREREFIGVIRPHRQPDYH